LSDEIRDLRLVRLLARKRGIDDTAAHAALGVPGVAKRLRADGLRFAGGRGDGK
jgi:hypothetical protein